MNNNQHTEETVLANKVLLGAATFFVTAILLLVLFMITGLGDKLGIVTYDIIFGLGAAMTIFVVNRYPINTNND